MKTAVYRRVGAGFKTAGNEKLDIRGSGHQKPQIEEHVTIKLIPSDGFLQSGIGSFDKFGESDDVLVDRFDGGTVVHGAVLAENRVLGDFRLFRGAHNPPHGV